MGPARSRFGVFLLALICLCTPAGAQTVFDVGPSRNRHVHELPFGAGHPPHHRPAVAGAGFRYASSYSLIYLFNAFPGAYTLVFSYQAGDVNLKPVISLFDRWPYDPLANRYDLPMGPVVTTNRKKIEYRWSMGISPASNSTLLYIAVEVPAGVTNSNFFRHDIYVTGPPPSPMFAREEGITSLSGPNNLVLASGRESVSFTVDKAEQTFDASALPYLPIPGDLVRNGSFRNGLTFWTPHRDRTAAEHVQSFSLSDGILKIRASEGNHREGVMQELQADVTDAASVILMADVQVREQTQGGLGPEGRDAPIAVAIGYRDSSGKEDIRKSIFWKGFYALASEDPDTDSEGQMVPKGQWVRTIFDLMQLEPKPATILFISLEGSGWPAREGWIRDVHLIKSGGR